MKNLDVKALKKLTQLKELLEADPDLNKHDLEKVTKMFSTYEQRGAGRPGAGFFTNGERKKMIDRIYDSYFYLSGLPKSDPWPDKERRLRDELTMLLERGDVPPGFKAKTEELLESLKSFRTGPTVRQSKFMKSLLLVARNSPRQKGLFAELSTRHAAGTVFMDPVTGDLFLGSMAFVESVMAQFMHSGWWSDLQQECVEDILNRNIKDAVVLAAEMETKRISDAPPELPPF